MKKSIIIVDDHLLFSQALEFLINTFNMFQVVDIYPNGKAFLEAYAKRDTMADIILLDVNMPIMNGIDTMKAIKKTYPEQKVLALSVNNEEETVMAMLTSGARGYLLKDTSPDNFQHALHDVTEKGFFYSEMVSGYLVNHLNHKEPYVFRERDLEFIKWACTEKTYKEIADLMFLSPKTIDGYRETIFRKIGVKTRIGLVLYAIKNKIIMV